MTVVYLSGMHLDNLGKALNDELFVGTIIAPGALNSARG
jgi:hypothetical protein